MGRTKLKDRATEVQESTSTGLRALVHDAPGRLTTLATGARGHAREAAGDARKHARTAAIVGRRRGEVVVEEGSQLGSSAFAAIGALLPFVSRFARKPKVRRTAIVAVRSHPVLFGGAAVAMALGGFILLKRRREDELRPTTSEELLAPAYGRGETATIDDAIGVRRI